MRLARPAATSSLFRYPAIALTRAASTSFPVLLSRSAPCFSRGVHRSSVPLSSPPRAAVASGTMSLTAAVPVVSSPPAAGAEALPAPAWLAVYGTLRDDDDSGATWTRDFLRGVAEARDGAVEGAEMFWSSEGLWPFVLLHPMAPALQEKLLEEQQPLVETVVAAPAVAAAAEGASAATSPAVPAALTSSIRVRLLRWPTPEEFAAKIVEADRIEGYDAANEASSEYVRRRVWVRLTTPSLSLQPSAEPAASAALAAVPGPVVSSGPNDSSTGGERVLAWLYVKQSGFGEVQDAERCERIVHGDWMRRDRSRRHPG